MSQHYYEPKDLKDFPNIEEYVSASGEKFFEYDASATGAGKLTEREKALIALAVSPRFGIVLTVSMPIQINVYPWGQTRKR